MKRYISMCFAAICLLAAGLTQAQGVQIVGAYSFKIISPTSVNLAVERIVNQSTTRTTGTLRLELWLSATPNVGQSFVGYRLATSPITSDGIGRLAPRQYVFAVNVIAPMAALPPPGDYFATLIVSEYTLSCGTADGFCQVAYGNFPTGYAVSTVIATPAVIEFYNSNLDHYFITSNAAEAGAIDKGGAGPGWVRTGGTFKSGGTAAVCRFYGSQAPGPNSHFYTVDGSECTALMNLQSSTPSTQKRWNLESLDFVSTQPVNGACPASTTPIYRAYNNGFARGVDSNHRITASAAAIQEVTARGWLYEGIVMCAPF